MANTAKMLAKINLPLLAVAGTTPMGNTINNELKRSQCYRYRCLCTKR